MKKLSYQKIFCFLSILFISCCFIFYGSRFVKLYLENKKIKIVEKNTLAKVLKENNDKNFKNINGTNYFTGDDDTNFVLYSNILWRVIRLEDDNSITLISNNSLTSLAFGNSEKVSDSYIYRWLNTGDSEYSGILEKSLNDVDNYLVKTSSCSDTIDELANNPCKEFNSDNYVSLLSVVDYLNIGSKNSYLANDEFFYLNNMNSDGKVWYVNDDGLANLSSGSDIIGIRPVITLKENVEYISGKGTKEDPYTIEKENGLFGSYVKLDNTLWRIYKVNDKDVRIMLNDYLKVNNSNLTYKYSNISSYHDDYKYGSIAYYLNRTFLNTLSYKNKIKDVSWTNGYYNSTTNYNYENALKDTIESKIALISIGDIYLNPELTNYFTMTGSYKNSQSVYTIQKNKKLYTKSIASEINVVPVMSIDKDLLTKGNGTISSPYEME